MNRRQFLGASIAGIIAALSLPFERFAEWWRELFERVAPAQLEALADAYEFRIGSYAQLVCFEPGMSVTLGDGTDSGHGTITAIDRHNGMFTVSA